MPAAHPVLRNISAAVALAAAACLVASPAAAAPTIAPAYAGSYSASNLGTPIGVPGSLGGIAFLDNGTILVGGSANTSNGAIYSIDVTRDAGTQQITGFAGPATLYASAPNIDGGLVIGPGGVLFYTAYPTNAIGQILPGGLTPALVTVLTPSFSSVGTLQFVPPGYPGAGNMVVGSYNQNHWGIATLTPDGSGTYTISGLTTQTNVGGGPEGIVYVPTGSPLFGANTALVSMYGLGKVQACAVDPNGLPTGPCTDFVTGLTGAEGAVIDPVTGSFLFSTFGSGNEVVVVSGFAAPPQEPTGVPEPATMALFGLGLLGLAGFRRQRT